MDGLAARILVSVAVVGIAAIDALYLAIIEMQDGVTKVDVLTVPFVASFLGLMAVLLGASLATPAMVKPVLRCLVCPPSGQGSGTTGALFGSVGYECNHGQLTVR